MKDCIICTNSIAAPLPDEPSEFQLRVQNAFTAIMDIL